jgi:NADPH:quinone reductase-like Zn-dependent oxidoreductase
MKALVLEEFNQPYQLKEIEKPVPGKGEVLVKIAASGVNPLDLKIKVGQAAHAKAKPPGILGIDMAGVVEAVGEGVTTFKPGDEVYSMAGGIAGVPGSLAEYMAADEKLLAIKPRNLSMKQAAALPLIFITAWEGLVDRANVGSGKTVLIHGGAGGVGHIAVQIARSRGAEVFSTVDTAKNDLMIGYGAVPIDYKTMTVDEYVNKYTHGEGFDVIFDTVGGEVLDTSFKAARQYYGHVVSILGWGTHHLAPLSFRGATYSGVFTLYPLISGLGRAHHGKILTEATALVETGQVIPNVDPASFTLETIEEAYEYMSKATGKVVVDINS